MSLLRAGPRLLWLSFRRLLWSGSTLMVLLPLSACTLFLLRRRFWQQPQSFEAFNGFSLFLMFVFASFVVPICAVAYATAASAAIARIVHCCFCSCTRAAAADFFRQIHRHAAAGSGAGDGVVLFLLPTGRRQWRDAYSLYLPAIFYMTIAYVSLFHFFAVSFRHSTIIALIYSLFMELLLGNMPGIVKRVAINYYGRSMMYAAGVPEGLERPDPNGSSRFRPPASASALLGSRSSGCSWRLVVFQRREYTDLT